MNRNYEEKLSQKIMSENYQQKLSVKIIIYYINDAEKLRFIGIMAYPTSKTVFKWKQTILSIASFFAIAQPFFAIVPLFAIAAWELPCDNYS